MALRLSSAAGVVGITCGAAVVLLVSGAVVLVVSGARAFTALPGPPAEPAGADVAVVAVVEEVVEEVDEEVDDVLVGSGATSASTGRKRSSAVLPTTRRALSRSFTPGRSTTIWLPSRFTSVSATPRPLTRLRMMSTALSSTALPWDLTGSSRTSMPPCRSSPSTGRDPPATVTTKVPTMSTTTTTRYHMLRRT